MSAKWRRTKTNSKRFSIFRVLSRVRNKKTSQAFRTKASQARPQISCRKNEIQKLSSRTKMREPPHLVDVLEGSDEIVIVAEIAGFNREDLRINVGDHRLMLFGEATDRKYRKSLNLPKQVIPSTLWTRYKNGVLEIRVKKAVEEKSIGKVVGRGCRTDLEKLERNAVQGPKAGEG
jgi:HSP20 family molecular chaperone IbpA